MPFISKEEESIQDIDDMNITREAIAESDFSIVVVKNREILAQKQGEGIRPMVEAIEELGQDMEGATVGDRILGKASALLCVYGKVKAVYAPQATKTAIAVLIQANIPGQTDRMIPFVKNKMGDAVVTEMFFEQQPLHLCDKKWGVLIPHEQILKRTALNWFCYIHKYELLTLDTELGSYFRKIE